MVLILLPAFLSANVAIEHFNQLQLPEQFSALPAPNQEKNFHIRLDYSRLEAFNRKENAAKNLNYHPDTVVLLSTSQNPRRYSYFYSQNGERLISFVKVYNNEEWVNLSYETCTYDINGNRLTSTWQVWQNNAWVNSSRSTFTYTVNNRLATITVQNWTASGWTNAEKTTNTYDVFGNRVAYKLEKWIDNSWTNFLYEIYTYDNQNNLINGVRQLWNAVYWLNNQQYSYTYNAQSQMLNATIQNWVEDGWQNFYSETYTYTENRLGSYTGLLWNNNSWVNDERYTYNYNAPGFLIEAKGEQWSNGAWLNDVRAQFSHNSFGGVQSGLYQSWANGSWLNQRLSDYSYDNAGNTTQLNLYFWNGNTWVQNADGVLELIYSQSATAMYLTGYRATASYISVVVDLEEMSLNEEFKVFPNPVQDQLSIRLNNNVSGNVIVTIYTIDGKAVGILYDGKAETMPDQLSIDVSVLNTGMYILNIQTAKHNHNKKIFFNSISK